MAITGGKEGALAIGDECESCGVAVNGRIFFVAV